MKICQKLLFCCFCALFSVNIFAKVNSFIPSYQWFKIIYEFPGGTVPYIGNAVHFSVYSDEYCSDDQTCVSYLVGTTFESDLSGSITFNDEDCSSKGLTIPLTMIKGNISTPSPVEYDFESCRVVLKGDANSEDGYTLTISAADPVKR